MPRLSRRAGPLGLALTAMDAWQRLSPQQRRAVVRHAKTVGPLVAAQTVRSARAAAASLKKLR